MEDSEEDIQTKNLEKEEKEAEEKDETDEKEEKETEEKDEKEAEEKEETDAEEKVEKAGEKDTDAEKTTNRLVGVGFKRFATVKKRLAKKVCSQKSGGSTRIQEQFNK
ncbi:hypothetical protein TNIN_135911 [Trichonephila inaurata madagascariensis]|uniref:Uncharacterized protein n=1 Tax=Trichonephila inaurata madagascariensis TaxID=2747483 RepID=A0A8X7C1M3_9ARAC|nr:hypothetical protein TNIN_135911 [Trichonephila inaurata madagascariensis]